MWLLVFLRNPNRRVGRPAGINTPENIALSAEVDSVIHLWGTAASCADRVAELARHTEDSETGIRERIDTGGPAPRDAGSKKAQIKPLAMKTAAEVDLAVLQTGPAGGFDCPTGPPTRVRSARIIADLGFPGVSGMGQGR